MEVPAAPDDQSDQMPLPKDRILDVGGGVEGWVALSMEDAFGRAVDGGPDEGISEKSVPVDATVDATADAEILVGGKGEGKL